MKLPWFTLGLIVLLFMMAGCTANIDLTLYEADEFQAVTRVEIPRGMDSPENMERQLDEFVAETTGKPGVTDAAWKNVNTNNENQMGYEITVGGTLEGLDAVLEDATVNPTTYQGRDALSFNYFSVPAIPYTLTLHADEILVSNGDLLDRDSVRWHQGSMTATVIPKSRSPLNSEGNIFLGLGALLAIGAAGLVFYGRRQGYFGGTAIPLAGTTTFQDSDSYAPPVAPIMASSTMSTKFCSECGTTLEANNRFCPTCGTPRPL